MLVQHIYATNMSLNSYVYFYSLGPHLEKIAKHPPIVAGLGWTSHHTVSSIVLPVIISHLPIFKTGKRVSGYNLWHGAWWKQVNSFMDCSRRGPKLKRIYYLMTEHNPADSKRVFELICRWWRRWQMRVEMLSTISRELHWYEGKCRSVSANTFVTSRLDYENTVFLGSSLPNRVIHCLERGFNNLPTEPRIVQASSFYIPLSPAWFYPVRVAQPEWKLYIHYN